MLTLTTKRLFLSLISGTVLTATAVVAGPLPTTLFDIELGSKHPSNPSNFHVININGTKNRGMNHDAGIGMQYFFEPQKTYPNFPLVERTRSDVPVNLETSFKLYLLPNKVKAKETPSSWEVVAIDWAADMPDENSAYRWAIDRCREYSQSISVKAEITDFPTTHWYECYFAESDRVLNIGGMGSRVNISLSYNPEQIIAKEKFAKNMLSAVK